ncbi:MAG: YbhB/YbcL family Raf kinase inhibitor-like protein [Gemmatales bacterium]|nr:YbhB/YbcL family Raf kinase inhibitor-like protein [Gemmatales bacterium]MCS7160690.1 YbhB/YbcL family Raf kinase inhibitor-like protein [Gemmatales bacterium]MDW8175891.1 YbhB/YbcL family Raf kinase inhibitor-like protein [Gemmatales bacterium]MDW8223340.1 YbhB/YbcL family Raf kinase inhibitor-like protein [Gemmatales bacterium]
MPMVLKSSAFAQGAVIPKEHTADGRDISPPLEWTDPPVGTQSFALLCEDPDAPRGLWVHWVLFNVPPQTRSLPAGVPPHDHLADGSRQGRNDFGRIGYGGPAPPRGKPHRYFFRLYALDTSLGLPPGATREMLLKAMHGHILEQAEVMGIYARP